MLSKTEICIIIVLVIGLSGIFAFNIMALIDKKLNSVNINIPNITIKLNNENGKFIPSATVDINNNTIIENMAGDINTTVPVVTDKKIALDNVTEKELTSDDATGNKVTNGDVPNGDAPNTDVPNTDVPNTDVPSGDVTAEEVTGEEVTSEEKDVVNQNIIDNKDRSYNLIYGKKISSDDNILIASKFTYKNPLDDIIKDIVYDNKDKDKNKNLPCTNKSLCPPSIVHSNIPVNKLMFTQDISENNQIINDPSIYYNKLYNPQRSYLNDPITRSSNYPEANDFASKYDVGNKLLPNKTDLTNSIPAQGLNFAFI